MGTVSVLKDEASSGDGWRGWLQNNGNVLTTTALTVYLKMVKVVSFVTRFYHN